MHDPPLVEPVGVLVPEELGADADGVQGRVEVVRDHRGELLELLVGPLELAGLVRQLPEKERIGPDERGLDERLVDEIEGEHFAEMASRLKMSYTPMYRVNTSR
jgi:hypothetical protein